MSRRHFSLFAPLLLLGCLSLAYADQSKGPRGGDGGPRGTNAGLKGEPDRRPQDSGQARRDVLREAVKSQEDDAPVLLRQLSAEDKALLRQQLRQQRLDATR